MRRMPAAPSPEAEAAASFAPLEPRLLRIAYRMLGSVADAEDAVQEAFIRWLKTDRSQVRAPEAFLRRTVARLCLDQLKSARARRETYIGPWLPEPLVEPEAEEALDDVTLPLMLALERLSPLERAAFLLHDVFGMSFAEVARVIERDAAACRQLASRARGHLQAARPRFPVAKEQGAALAAAFFTASRSGDLSALQSLLAADVVLYSDGGGKVAAAPYPIASRERVARFFARLADKLAEATLLGPAVIDGLPGYVTRDPQGNLQTTAFAVEEGRITAVYVVRNPDKLRHLAGFAG